MKRIKNIRLYSPYSIRVASFLLLSLVFLTSCQVEKEEKAAQNQVLDSSPLKIALSGFDNNTGWSAIEAQIKSLAEGSDMLVQSQNAQGPNYLRSQREEVSSMVNDSLSGVILWPADEVGLFDPVQELLKKSVPTVAIEKPLQDNIQISTVHTDGEELAKQALTSLQGAMGDKTKLMLFYYAEGSQDSPDILPVLKEVLKSDFPTLEVVAEQSFTSPEEPAAFAEAEKSFLLNPQVQGVLCTDADGALGVIRALKDIDRAISTPVVSIGYQESLKLQIESRTLHAVVDKDYAGLGKAAYNILKTYLETGEAPKDSAVAPVVINAQNPGLL